jgi:predicted nucleic acid-binding protein
MTSFSNPKAVRGLDTMVIVYSLLDDHPASAVCEQFIRGHAGWFTTTFTLRQQMSVWERANLPAKGLPRVLRQVHYWLNQANSQTAQDFWSQTGGCSHLP